MKRPPPSAGPGGGPTGPTLRLAQRFAAGIAATVLGFAATPRPADSAPRTPVEAGLPIPVRVGSVVRGERFHVFGENLAGARVIAHQPPGGTKEGSPPPVESLPDRPALPAEPPATAERAPVFASFDQALFASLPNPGLERGARSGPVVLIWLRNDRGTSRPIVANRPEVWLQSHRTAAPGEHVKLFGVHLKVRGVEGIRVALRHTGSGEVRVLPGGNPQAQRMPHQREHKFDVLLPEGLPPGRYQLFAHNGTGGAHGWSDPVELEVIGHRDFIGMKANTWNRQGVHVPVAADHDVARIRVTDASLADGVPDATAKLQDAIDRAAEEAPGVVHLPPGVFQVSRTLELKPGVVLRGAGRGATTVTAPPAGLLTGEDRKDGRALIRIRTRAGLEDIELVGGAGVGLLACVWPDTRVDGDTAYDVFFNRVNGRFCEKQRLGIEGRYAPPRSGLLIRGNAVRLVVYDCRIVAATSFAGFAGRFEQLRLIGNHFEVSPRQASINVVLRHCHRSIVTDNTFLHGSRSMISQNGFSRNWVFQNISEGVGRSGNGGEQFMSEFAKSAWVGRAEGIGEQSVTLPAGSLKEADIDDNGLGSVWANLGAQYFVFVAAGRGLGQYRAVASVEGEHLMLAEPWAVPPDTDTTLALVAVSHHNLWVNNTCKDGDGMSQFVYGSGVENVVAGHLMMHNGGMNMHARKRFNEAGEITRYGVVAFNRWIGNRSRYAGNHDAAFQLWRVSGETFPVTHLGNVLRHNVAVGRGEAAQYQNQYGDYWNQHNVDYIPRLAAGFELLGVYNLVEHNLVNGLPVGVRVTRGVGNVVADNRIDHTMTAEVIDESGTAVIKPPPEQDYQAAPGPTP